MALEATLAVVHDAVKVVDLQRQRMLNLAPPKLSAERRQRFTSGLPSYVSDVYLLVSRRRSHSADAVAAQ